jgi:uncharacterized membrane protein
MLQNAHAVELTNVQHRTVTRLESFGDIVYGLSLVLMASRLRVPERPEELIAELPEFAIFILAFAILSFLWFRHHTILRDLFVPDTLGNIVNFVALAAIAVFPYPFELYLKFGASSAFSLAAYAAVLTVLNASIAALYYKGLYQRGQHLDQKARTGFAKRADRCLNLAVAFGLCDAAYPYGAENMIAVTAGALVLGFIIMRFVRGGRTAKPGTAAEPDASPTA